MAQTEEFGPFGTAFVGAIVGGFLVSNPSVLSSMPTVRWIMILGMVSAAIGGIAVGVRDL